MHNGSYIPDCHAMEVVHTLHSAFLPQIELEFNVITSESIKKRAREAIDLLHASKHRSDSVTKGREFIKPQL